MARSTVTPGGGAAAAVSEQYSRLKSPLKDTATEHAAAAAAPVGGGAEAAAKSAPEVVDDYDVVKWITPIEVECRNLSLFVKPAGPPKSAVSSLSKCCKTLCSGAGSKRASVRS